MSYISLGRLTTTVILTVTGLLTAAALAVTGAFQLTEQTPLQILYTESGGVVTTTSNLRFTSSTPDLLVGGVSVCLQDGSNCPASSASTSTFQDILANGNTATSSFITYGNATTSNLYATGTFGVAGLSAIANATFGTATGTGLHAAVLCLTGDTCRTSWPAAGSISQLSQVINAGSTATSSPNFSVGFSASTATVSGLSDLATVTYTNATGSGSLKINQLSVTNMISDLNPITDNSLSLGTQNIAWKNVYASGTVYAGGGTAGAPGITFGNDNDTGLYLFTGNVFRAVAGGSPVFQFGGSGGNQTSVNFTPDADASLDTGSAALQWKTVYTKNVIASGWVTSTHLNLTSSGNITTNGANSFATIVLSGRSGEALTGFSTSTQIAFGTTFVRSLPAFAATNTNCVYWGPEFIRDAWDGSTMSVSLTWTSVSGTGNVIWALRAQTVASGTYMGAGFTGAKSYATGTQSQGYYMVTNPMTTLTVGSAAAGKPMAFELCREGNHGQDTFGGDAYPDSVKIEYGLSSYSD